MTLYRHQTTHQKHYRIFCKELGVVPHTVEEIPLMPIQVFRIKNVVADYVKEPETVFYSSGTSGGEKSSHPIADLLLYQASCYEGFSSFYDPDKYAILAYLPGYLENPHSSLIAMIDYFIQKDATGISRYLPLLQFPGEQKSGHEPYQPDELKREASSISKPSASFSSDADTHSGEILCEALEKGVQEAKKANKKIMLFGAAFGLLPLADERIIRLPVDSVVVETGGMKSYEKEISKKEIKERLSDGFGLPKKSIHSEYGMAELSSQAWDNGTGYLVPPPWLRITIQNPEYPLETMPLGERGLVGVMDLANIHSLSFILTQDMGLSRPDGSFEVLGRETGSVLRGCNFLME